MSLLFGATALVGAALMFAIEPMIARQLLPRLGGSPAVWNTCLVFFQATLLAAYLYVHWMTSRFAVRSQARFHACLVVLALGTLWWSAGVVRDSDRAAPDPERALPPAVELIGLLLTTLGPPFFMLAATAPLLQRWFAAIGPARAADPYFLYALSNLGSLLGLLAYPLVIEPNLPMAEQERLWAVGYDGLAVLVLACAVVAGRSSADPGPGPSPRARPRFVLRLRWMALAFVPSSLLLGVTTWLTTDLAPVPLLWVVPLFLYLLSLVLVFARSPLVPHALMLRALPLLVAVLVPMLAAGLVQPFCIPIHLLTFFVAAMVCHGELARLRPPASDLTAFYLAIAVGGALGGSFNALVAPVVFDRIVEYPLGVFLACLCLPEVGRDASWRGVREGVLPLLIGILGAMLVRDVGGIAESTLGVAALVLASGLMALVALTAASRPLRFALGVVAVLAAGGLSNGVEGAVLHRERTFFGVLRVTELNNVDGPLHRLFHGTTLHGQQRLTPAGQREPLAYYHPSGPIGQVFEVMHGRVVPRDAVLRVAVVGLGAGSLAAYARAGERWTFYEIDPAIVRISRDPRMFTFLGDSRATTLDVIVGDARLRLRAASDRCADLIVLDAFGSDAIPMHLLTREALCLYRAKLGDHGLIALHLSNRTLDLEPVIGQLARDAGLVARVRHDRTLSPQERRLGKSKSVWAVLAAQGSDLGPLAADRRWQPPRLDTGDRVWTDDDASILRHLVLFGRHD